MLNVSPLSIIRSQEYYICGFKFIWFKSDDNILRSFITQVIVCGLEHRNDNERRHGN